MCVQEIAISNTNNYTEYVRGKEHMAHSVNKSSNIYVRIDPETKKEAEKVFDKLGLTMSQAVVLFLKQAVIQQGFPIELSAAPKGLRIDYINKEDIDAKLQVGLDDVKNGRTMTAEEVKTEMESRHGIKV